jgi:hypothetical protein
LFNPPLVVVELGFFSNFNCCLFNEVKQKRPFGQLHQILLSNLNSNAYHNVVKGLIEDQEIAKIIC